MSNRAVTDSIEVLMKKYMEDYIADLSKKKGEMPVTVNSVIIGKGTPNDEMKKEMDHTAAMIQERKSQEQREATQKARESAERQRAISDKTYMREMGLTPEQYIQLRLYEIIEKKNGANIDVMVGPATSMWNVRR
jgi:antitoxin component of RelBE/YafQ-DinJ toxin-antitoxin module